MSRDYIEKLSPFNIFKRIWICLIWILRDIINPFRTILIKNRIKESNPYGKIWIFISSKNHFDSIGFLRESLRDTIIVVPHLRRLSMTDFIFPYYFKALYYIKLPLLWIGLLIQHNKIAYRYYNFLFEAIGVYEISLYNLKKYNPKAIIFANDHIFKHRALLLAAKKLKIKTCYLQHASVSDSFPPLSFDLALLEGKDSYNKYLTCGEIKSEVKFVGMPKFDNYVENKKASNGEINTIGIAINLLDDLRIVSELIQEFNDHLPNKTILLRKHPQDKRDLITRNLIFIISDPKEEKAFDFISRVDVLISGDSSIHLEAALLHVPSIIYGFNNRYQFADYYEYAKNGLVHIGGKPNGIINMIRKKDFSFNIEKLKYYNDVVGTKWEGKSKKLIIRHLNEYID